MPQSTSNISKAVVAMSGGVDSSVAALLLARLGIPLIGVSMQVWDYRRNGGCHSKATCCSPDDFTDARMVAAKAGIPYYVFDFEETFGREVIDRFAQMYLNGKTPNPCVDCNARVKFRELRKRALALGCSHVATGHYAQIHSDSGGTHLIRSVDRQKDQTYFLYNLTQADLLTTIFPVGGMNKAQVREYAREAGLSVAEKAESQDICFVSDSVHEFLVRIGKAGKPGPIKSIDGTTIGEHQGLDTVTIGQRRGLKVGGTAEPFYVLEINSQDNSVLVGPKKNLDTQSFFINELNILSPSIIGKQEFEALVQVRHRHIPVPVRVKLLQDGIAEVSFLNECAVAAPGQAGVFYDHSNNELIGGGRIVSTKYTKDYLDNSKSFVGAAVRE